MIGNDEVLKYLLEKEGFLEEPTNIGDGVFTIGSGLTDKKWHNLYKKRGNVWSLEDNRRAVLEEIQKRRVWAALNIPNWNILPEASLDALLSYKYNYNFTPTNSPNLYLALLQKDWSRAAKEMDATSKTSKFKKGLLDRREEELNWFLSGFNKKYEAPVKYKPKVLYVNKNPYNPFPVPLTLESRVVEYTPTRNDSIYGGGARANGGYLFNKGGKKDDRIKELNWPSLSTVDYNVYPDTTFVADSNNLLGYISTITPDLVKKLWGDDVTDYEANRIWYENNNPIGIYVNDKEELINPKFNSNAIIYNPNYANEDAIALDALHIMHDSPIYQELYSLYMDSMPLKYGPLIEAANDEFGDYGISVIEKYLNGIPLTKEELEIVEPIYDALLRRLLAPDYMRNIRGLYQDKAVLPNIPAIGMSGDEAIRLYLESYPLPEINVTNEHSKGGKLNTPLEWEELTMKDRALHIRDAVSRGLYDISDIKKDYNEFKKGGPKKTNTSAKLVFLNSLEKSLKGNSRYNTENWRKYFTELAAVESSYNPNITNNIGAKGYFQLMPFNRASSWNSDVLQFYELYRMLDANMNYFKKNLTKEDLVRANLLGIDIYGLMAGAHLGGAKGALNALRGKNNAKDANGTSVLSYMTRFSLTTPRNVNIEGQMKSLSPYTTVPKELPVDIYKGIQLLEPMPDIQVPVGLNTVLKENETITGQPIPEVVVTPLKQKVIIPTDTYSDIRELAPALTSTVTPYVIPSVSEKINAMSTDRNTLLQRDLEDSILRNLLLGTYDENKLKKDIEDLRFYLSMSGGNTLATGGDTDTTFLLKDLEGSIARRLKLNMFAFGGNSVEDGEEDNNNPRPITTGGAGYIPPVIDDPVAQIRKYLYKHISPISDYNIKKTISGALEGEFKYKKRGNSNYDYEKGYPINTDYTSIRGIKAPLSVVDGVWAEYLQIPEKDRKQFIGPKLKQSKYAPSMGNTRNAKYYALPLTEGAKDLLVREGMELPHGKNKVTDTLESSGRTVYNLGDHTIGRGMDENGDYISYYDVFDLNPLSDKYNGTNIPLLNKLKDVSFGIGKPVNIYDRIYLDDYYDVPYPYKGSTYLPEVTIYGKKKKKALGGKLYGEGGDTDTTTSFVRKGTETPVYLEQDTGYFVDPNTGEKGTWELPGVTVYNDYNHNINGQLRKALPSVFDVTDVSNLAEALGYDPATIKTMADLKKTPQEKGLEIVSPEFAALTLGRAGLNGGLDFLKPGSTFWQNPITQQIAAGELGGRGVDVLTNAMTPYSSFAEGVVTETGIPEVLAEALNPGYYVSPASTTKAIENAVGNINNLGRLAKPMFNKAALAIENYRYPLGRPQVPEGFGSTSTFTFGDLGDKAGHYIHVGTPKNKVWISKDKTWSELSELGENSKGVPLYQIDSKAYDARFGEPTLVDYEGNSLGVPISKGSWEEPNSIFRGFPQAIISKEQMMQVPYTKTARNPVTGLWEKELYQPEKTTFLEETPTVEWPMGKTASEITAENAASITPEQWTAAQDAAIARGNVAEASNTLLEQESLIPSFLRRNTETVTPITEESILKDLEAAEAYKESPEYQSLVQSFIEETGHPDIPISIFYNSRKSEIPNIVLESRPEGHLGGYRYTDNKLSIDTGLAKSDVPFHEGLHWQRVGEVPNILETSPEYKAWAESYWNKAPDDVQLDLFTAYYNSGLYEKLLQQNAAIKDLYKQKVDDVLYEDAVDSELRKPHELIAHTFGTGKALGLKPFQEYPGMQKASEIIEKARNLNGWLRDIKAGTEEEIKKFWKLLTGSYAPSLLIGTSTVGAMGNVNNTEQNGQ